MPRKKNNLFVRIIMVLFVVFLGLFIAAKSGYYETRLNKQVVLTSEAIKQFESDVQNGKKVDINNYITKDTKDYTNSFTRAGEKLAKACEKLLTGGITNIWEFFKVLF